MDAEAFTSFYTGHLLDTILPFWLKGAVDTRRGGVYTCFDNSGSKLVSKDKYTWSQGRFVWMMARMADLCDRGLIPADGVDYREIAAKTADFLLKHVFLPNGYCVFAMDEEGNPLDPQGHGRLDVSIYADCFVSLGFLELARVDSSETLLERAWSLYLLCGRRIQSGDYLIEPYPVPAEITVHGIPMILLNVAVEFYAVFERLGDVRGSIVKSHIQVYVQ